MPSVTIKPPAPHGKKRRTAAQRTMKRAPAAEGTDFAALAAEHRGMFRGPRDLSTREGYGR